VQRAAKTLSLQLETARARISSSILDHLGEGDDVSGALAGFRERFADDLERIRQVIEDVRAAERPELPALMVAVHAIGSRRFGKG
jgi:hypothetical protein